MTVERDGDWAPDTPARRAWEFLFGTDKQLGLFNWDADREAENAYGETQTGKILSDEDEILDGPEDNWGGW